MRKSIFVLTAIILYISFMPFFTPELPVSAAKPVILESAPASLELGVSAQCAMLMSIDGKIIYEKNADRQAEPASTTKIMTALLVLELLDPEMLVSVPKQAVGIEGSSIYLQEGEKLTVRELTLGLLLESGNDAAIALSIAAAGSTEAFVALMNERAKEMGLNDTHFDNPHGLSSDSHYTTAHDLAIIACNAMKNELFSEYASTYKTSITGYGSDSGRLLINHNRLLKMYDGALGIKTGFTKSSGRTLVGAAQRDGLTLITVTLNAPNDWKDHITMFDAGFGLYEQVEICAEKEKSFTVEVIGGSEKTLVITNQASLTLMLPKDSTVTFEYRIPDFVYAPVNEGDFIGEIIVKVNSVAEGSIYLTAAKTIGYEKISFWKKIFG